MLVKSFKFIISNRNENKTHNRNRIPVTQILELAKRDFKMFEKIKKLREIEKTNEKITKVLKYIKTKAGQVQWYIPVLPAT